MSENLESFGLRRVGDFALDSSASLRVLHHLVETKNAPYEELADYQEKKEKFDTSKSLAGVIDNVILGGYVNIDPAQINLLINYGISAKYITEEAGELSPSGQISLLEDILDANEMLFKKPFGKFPKFLEEVHKNLTRAFEAPTGFRTEAEPDQSPEYLKKYKFAKPEEIVPLLEEYFDCLDEYVEDTNISIADKAAYIQKEILKISPFATHNDLLARLLSSHLMQRMGYFPNTSLSDSLEAYQEAMVKALSDELEPLADLIEASQIQNHLEFLFLGNSLKESTAQNEMLSTLLELPEEADDAIEEKLEKVDATVRKLWELIGDRFHQVADEYNENLDDEVEFSFVDVSSNDDEERKHWYLFQVVTTARAFGYWATPEVFHYWAKLGYTFKQARYEIFCSFHVVGKGFNGPIAATMCSYSREMGTRRIDNFEVVCNGPFLVLPEHEVEDLEDNFSAWLEEGLSKGIAYSKTMQF